MTATLHSTPAADGFHMPGEFALHRGCWLLWPERGDTWRLGGRPAQQAFMQVAAAIANSEPVTVGVSATQFVNARRMLPETVRVVASPGRRSLELCSLRSGYFVTWSR